MILERFKVPEKDQVLVSEAALGRSPFEHDSGYTLDRRRHAAGSWRGQVTGRTR